jgi:hypothetical protein
LPEIPFIDVLGSVGIASPAQMIKEVPKLKTGVLFGVTDTVNEVVVAH